MRTWSLIRLFTLLVYLFMFTPIAIVVILSFNDAQFGDFPIEGFSFRWFQALADNDAIVRACRTSLLLGLVAAVIATTLGILASLALMRYRVPASNFFNTLLISPVLIPETVLAVGLLLFMRAHQSDRPAMMSGSQRRCCSLPPLPHQA